MRNRTRQRPSPATADAGPHRDTADDRATGRVDRRPPPRAVRATRAAGLVAALPVLLIWACASDVEQTADERPVARPEAHAGRVEEALADRAARPDPAPPADRFEAEENASGDRATSVARAKSADHVETEVRAWATAAAPPASAVAAQRHPGPPAYAPMTADTEAYPAFEASGIQRVATDPVSTFSVDVDTAAYANVRRMLEDGLLPPREAVRIEELINYFDYAYPQVARGAGFGLDVEVGPSPFDADRELLRIAIAAERPDRAHRVGRNIVLLVDSSGSMRAPDKLPLLQRALALLVRQFDAADRISLVTYAGSAAVVLPPTAGDRHGEILAAIDGLAAGGGTHGSAGISTAYALARQAWIDGGANRVILATDGDFNVGAADPAALEALIDRERRSGVGLTVLGFGTGNYDDEIAQRLAQHGDGIAAYVDSLQEARKVLVDELDGQLHGVGRDVKVQVEFNPRLVSEYRLIGYETRALRREDFDDDAVDAGDVGVGHQVTALYEITRTGSPGERFRPLRYGQERTAEAPRHERDARAGELAHVRMRWQPVDGGDAREKAVPVRADAVASRLDATGDDFRFSAAVAAFGEALRGGRRSGELDLAAVEALARDARGADPSGERSAFLGLVRLAAALAPADQRLGALE
ncbi:MAG TPA: von Willebrand factor type A domain-containing protein [Pseudomonadales bacterium]|nr:von Willebrand factor type A domain-containing protein [Pseudomonadales bacterium]